MCFKGEVVSTVEGMADAMFWLSERRKRQRVFQDDEVSTALGKP